MEAHSQPAKLPRFSDSTAGIGVVMMGSTEDRSAVASIGLDLGLGPRLAIHARCGFTFLQLQELEHQALIFKYMAAGVPVPSHLVIPIWKSLSASTAITGMYPSFLGFRGVCFDYKNSMEAEPGRCRRTDGKKWRCSKEVVPDQKYCERHMHRGRNRSRKHVESTSQLSNLHTNSNSNNNNLSISMPLQLMTPNTTTTTTTSFTHSHSFVQHNGICKAESTL